MKGMVGVKKEIHIGNQNLCEMKNIMFCGDSKYIKYIGITLTSILVSSNDETIAFHIICDDVIESDLEKFNNIVKQFKCTINIYLLDSSHIHKMEQVVNQETHINVAGLFRIVGFDILSEHIDKVLYMDADILVSGSISKFWDTPINEFVSIVIEDDTGSDEAKRVGVARYFNSGVMFVDLLKWRSAGLTKKCLDVLFCGKRWIFVDQDVLNIVLNGKCEWFTQEYNCFYNLNRVLLNKKISLPDLPIIYHFIGATKPWHACSQVDFVVQKYMKIVNVSQWADLKLIDVEEIKDLKHKWTVYKILSYRDSKGNKIKSIYYFIKYLWCKVVYRLNF